MPNDCNFNVVDVCLTMRALHATIMIPSKGIKNRADIDTIDFISNEHVCLAPYMNKKKWGKIEIFMWCRILKTGCRNV